MKNIRYTKLLLLVLVTVWGMGARAQSTLYSEDFNGGSHTWSLSTIRTIDGLTSRDASGPNDWVVNNVYTGGCGGWFDIPPIIHICFREIANTPDEPAGIAGNPQSNYMHLLGDLHASQNPPVLSASVNPSGDGAIPDDQYYFTEMTTDISTLGKTDVKVNFWWLNIGDLLNYGQLFYSTDGGTTWTFGGDTLKGQSTWKQTSFPTVTGIFDNLAQLRIGFRFTTRNNALVTPADLQPALAIDDVTITEGTVCNTPCDVNSVPQNVSTSNIRNTSVVVKWDVQPCVWRYRVYYRRAGVKERWNCKNAGATAGQIKITGLTPGTAYECEIITSCSRAPLVLSNPSQLVNFSTTGGSIRLEDAMPTASDIDFTVYPNPNSGTFTLSFLNNASESATVLVYNMIGQVVYSEKVNVIDGVNSINIELANKVKGLYTVFLKTSSINISAKLSVE